MSAFEIPFRRTFAWLRALLIPAARFGVRGAIILYGAVLLLGGIWLSWFGDGPPPGAENGFSLSVMELPQEALEALEFVGHDSPPCSCAFGDGVRGGRRC